MEVADERFCAMGGEARVLVVGGAPDAVERARARVEQLEARWSRFRADSEVSRLNRSTGRPVVVSDDTFVLVDRACAGWRRSDGRFDPTVLTALERLGYDRTFADIAAARPVGSPQGAPGCSGIVLDATVRAVTLPDGVEFDPGGIGKGLAADLVAAELRAAGAAGVLVSLGGDLRVSGRSPSGAPWRVAVEDPRDPTVHRAVLEVDDAGVATTSRTSRTWRVGDMIVHHVIDPSRGVPAPGPLSITVVATDAWIAEVAAKSAFVAGEERAADVLRALGVAGVIVGDAGGLEIVEGPSDVSAELLARAITRSRA
ncbi:MAG TPA: FAD:protein FMN transferase [Acidimicrobiia bacterium]|nr:FAD:protein FMN transferase [Acidimicrobiia bacterium]